MAATQYKNEVSSRAVVKQRELRYRRKRDIAAEALDSAERSCFAALNQAASRMSAAPTDSGQPGSHAPQPVRSEGIRVRAVTLPVANVCCPSAFSVRHRIECREVFCMPGGIVRADVESMPGFP